jgi:hypothetical protein
MPKVRLNNVTREAALAALFNRAKPQGLGKLQYDNAHVMTEEEARIVLMNGDYVDYLEGRVIKVDFKNPEEIDTTLYDRDNGKDAGEGAVFFARYRHIAIDGDNGFIPFRIMGHRVEEARIAGTVAFMYDGVIGGTLFVYMRPEVYHLQTRIYFELHHHDLGKEYMTICTNVEYLARRREEFDYCIERVINQAVRRMLEKDKE